MSATAATRDAGRGIRAMIPEPETVMPSDGSIPEITHGTPQNSIAQEAKSRFNDAAGEVESDWMVPLLVEMERDRLIGWQLGVSI